MNTNKMNRRGGERVLSLYWFVIFIILIIAVVSGVYIFFSKPLDIRQAESRILNDKIVECLVDKGNLISFEINEENLKDKCKINLDDGTEIYEESQYFVHVKFKDLEVKIGDESYEAFCGQKQSKLNVPYCYDNKMMVLDQGNFVELEVITSIGKIKQNAA